jgi:redox-sensitive bicupin YhaK (pirin superfamily)
MVGDKDHLEPTSIGVLDGGSRLRLRADRMRAVAVVAAAKPIREPVVRGGPFVVNTEAEIRKAWEDYRNGTLVR